MLYYTITITLLYPTIMLVLHHHNNPSLSLIRLYYTIIITLLYPTIMLYYTIIITLL